MLKQLLHQCAMAMIHDFAIKSCATQPGPCAVGVYQQLVRHVLVVLLFADCHA
jgi:hypothetical protein